MRLEFELNARVRLWWGVLGVIYEARGMVERERVFDDVWAQTRQEIYTDVLGSLLAPAAGVGPGVARLSRVTD